MGTIAEQRTGTYEFIPHRSSAFCAALRLPAGPHVAKNYPAIQRLVRGLLKRQEPAVLPQRYVVIRPDGRAWNRPFTNEAAGWRLVVKGTSSPAEWRRRKAEALHAGWTVQPV